MDIRVRLEGSDLPMPMTTEALVDLGIIEAAVNGQNWTELYRLRRRLEAIYAERATPPAKGAEAAS